MRPLLPIALAGFVCTLLAGPSPAGTGAGGVSLEILPDPLGPGDDIVATVHGAPGDIASIFASSDPGPTTLPFVGTLEVGLESFVVFVLGPIPPSGEISFPCDLNCAAAAIDPYYAQAVTIAMPPPFLVTGKSEQEVVTIDDSLIQDCNGNGQDDDCEGLPDCNGNGIPDECDIASGTSPDVDGDGIPDECCPDLCRLEVEYAFDGPLPAGPRLLTIRLFAIGVPAAARNEIEFVAEPPLPASISSPNGALTASNFQFPPTGGLTFDVVYEPDLAVQPFGTTLYMIGEVEGHCERETIASSLRTRCELTTGAVISSTAGAGRFEVLAADTTCP